MRACLWLALVLIAVKAQSSESLESDCTRTTRIRVVNQFYDNEMLLTASFLQKRRSKETNQIIAEYKNYRFSIRDRNSQQELVFMVPLSRINDFALTLQYSDGSDDEDSTCIAIASGILHVPIKEMLVSINEGCFHVTYQANLPSPGQFSTQ